jgi:hypothetical protein
VPYISHTSSSDFGALARESLSICEHGFQQFETLNLGIPLVANREVLGESTSTPHRMVQNEKSD